PCRAACGDPRALAQRLGQQRHQRDQRRPDDEDVSVEHRYAEHIAGHVEKREDRIIEEQDAERAQRDEALAPAFEIAHPASLAKSFQPSVRGLTTETLHGASATTWAATPGKRRVGAPLLEAPITIWSTSVIVA